MDPLSKNSGSAPGECGSPQLEQDPHFSNDLGMVGPDFGGFPYHCLYNGSTYIADFCSTQPSLPTPHKVGLGVSDTTGRQSCQLMAYIGSV